MSRFRFLIDFCMHANYWCFLFQLQPIYIIRPSLCSNGPPQCEMCAYMNAATQRTPTVLTSLPTAIETDASTELRESKEGLVN